MKIAISGKGGVGKTTLSAMLASVLGLQGRRVIALDADPDANLASALGVPLDQQPVPLAEMSELIAERTGAADGYGGYFKLNPKVDDLPERFAATVGPVRVLAHLVLGRDESVVMDMEAGIEHLGRATGQSMDGLVLVVDGGPWSLQTARRTRRLAADIGLTKLFAVANRLADGNALDSLAEQLAPVPLIGHVPYDRRLVGGVACLDEAGRLVPGEALADHRPAIEDLLDELERRL